MGKDKQNYVYPDAKSTRSFAQKDAMSVRDIIEGIAKENGIQIGDINLSSGARRVNFDKISVRYQRDMSDWQFLTQLAKDFDCTVWISRENDVEKLYFMSWGEALKKQGDISFFYPLYGSKDAVMDSEIQKFRDPQYNRPRILREVQVDEDVSKADSVSRSSAYFDKETGDQKNVISRIEEGPNGRREVVFYELNEARVKQIHDTAPDIADEIVMNSPSSLKWGTPDNPRCASYYYTEVRRYEEHQAVFDEAGAKRGIKVTAKVNQDLSLRTHRTYKIRGLVSYNTKDMIRPYLLQSLKHIWASDGNWTELEFIL